MKGSKSFLRSYLVQEVRGLNLGGSLAGTNKFFIQCYLFGYVANANRVFVLLKHVNSAQWSDYNTQKQKKNKNTSIFTWLTHCTFKVALNFSENFYLDYNLFSSVSPLMYLHS